MKEKTILVVDDDADIREVMQVLLKSEGYHVFTAMNGEDALNKIDESVDLYILDVMIPL